MPIPVACQCGQQFAANDELAGKSVRCPNCGNALMIPAGPAPAGPSFNSPSPLGTSAELAGPSTNWSQAAMPGKKRGANRGLLFGLIGGGAALLVVVIVVVVATSGSGEEESPETASKSGAEPEPAGGSNVTDVAPKFKSSDAASNGTPQSTSSGVADVFGSGPKIITLDSKLAQAKGPFGWKKDPRFDNRGSIVAMKSGESTLIVWPFIEGGRKPRVRKVISLADGSVVETFTPIEGTYSPDGAFVLERSYTQRTTMTLHRASGGEPLWEKVYETEPRPQSLFNPTDKTLFVALPNECRILDRETGEVQSKFKTTVQGRPILNPQGTMLAIAADGPIHLYDGNSSWSEKILSHETEGWSENKNRYVDLVYSPDGNLFVGVSERQADVWRVSDGKHLMSIQYRKRLLAAFKCAAFTPVGDVLGVGGRVAYLLDARNGQLLGAVKPWSDVAQLVFRDDIMVTCGSQMVELWRKGP